MISRLAALDTFLTDVVEPLEEAHSDLLTDPRQRYAASGVLSPGVLGLKREVRTAAAAAGLYALMIPPGLGGPGLTAAHQYAIWCHLYARCGPDRILPYDSLGSFTSGPGAALGGLSERARTEVWPRIISGEQVLCFALSERRGSAHGDVRTTASATKEGFVLRGEKTWVSRGGYADYALVYAMAQDPGQTGTTTTSAFLVPLSARGVNLVSVSRLLGRIGGEEVTLAFNDVQVSQWQLVGEVGGGGALAASGAASSTTFAAGRFVGLAQWALRHVAAATGTSESLREATREVQAIDRVSKAFAAQADLGQRDGPLQTMVRIAAPAICGRVFERAMQIEGSEALVNEARLFDGWHQSRIVQVAQGGIHDEISVQVLREAERLALSAERDGPG
ncbi:MAG: acyl-CoA/acyl-ACP dehydrogenase [Acidimicrobiaceae bacterium]|nr:acyl-CoA/acyl-ACP dehydrogenase [Acidimicrobiaceae bacterium]